MNKSESFSNVISVDMADYKGIFFCAFLSAVCVVTTAKGMPIIATFATIIFAVFAANKSTNEILMFLALAIPNTRSMEAFGISGAILACALFLILHLFCTQKINRKILVIGIIYLIYSFQYIVRFDDIKIGFIMPLKIVMVLWAFMFIANDLNNTHLSMENVLRINNSMFIGIVSAVIASIISTGSITRLSVVENDPNMLAVECAFVLSVYCIAYFEAYIKNLFFIGTTIVLIFLGIMCGSRMGILLLLFVIIVSILLNTKRTNRTLLFILVSTIAVIIFLSSNTGQHVLHVLEERSTVLSAQNNISNGRFDLWKEYFDTFNSNKSLWLLGFGSYTYYGLYSMAHNFLIEDLASYGIIGTTLIYYAYCVIFKTVAVENRKYNNKIRFFTVIPFIVPLIGGMTLHGISSTPNFFMMFVGIMVIFSINSYGGNKFDENILNNF